MINTTLPENLESVITRHNKNVYPVWLCLLCELSIMTGFWKHRILRICDAIFTTDEKYDVVKILMWCDLIKKIVNIVEFSST